MTGEIPVLVPARKTECVYILRHRGVIVYVGISNQVIGRIGSHFNEGEKIFDSASYIALPDREAAMALECKLASLLQPKYNTKLTKRSAEQWNKWYANGGKEWWAKVRFSNRLKHIPAEPT